LHGFVSPLPLRVHCLLVSLALGHKFRLVVPPFALQGTGKPGAIFTHLADLLVTRAKKGGGIGQAQPQVFNL
ncbi:MAG TPA: hypothetical protein PLW86_15955, partial [Rhodocyclaceae bacterium]|nr:hypothetical protein [Rhodocyclaceae bacterium]